MASQTHDEVQWLTEAEQEAWRAYLRGSRALVVALDDALLEEGIRLSEYEIVSMLSEAEGGRLRMSQLAAIVVQSRSRLTHTAKRLERMGWVQRRSCLDDRRGVELVLTDTGRRAVEGLAASHVRSVREHLIDVMTPQEFATLGDAMGKVLRAAQASGVDTSNAPGIDTTQ